MMPYIKGMSSGSSAADMARTHRLGLASGVLAGWVSLCLAANPHYRFSYGVSDSHTGDVKQHTESRVGGAVEGSYSLLEPDGTTRTVHYTADDIHGFVAQVQRGGHGLSGAPTAGQASGRGLSIAHTSYPGNYNAQHGAYAILARHAPGPGILQTGQSDSQHSLPPLTQSRHLLIPNAPADAHYTKQTKTTSASAPPGYTEYAGHSGGPLSIPVRPALYVRTAAGTLAGTKNPSAASSFQKTLPATTPLIELRHQASAPVAASAYAFSTPIFAPVLKPAAAPVSEDFKTILNPRAGFHKQEAHSGYAISVPIVAFQQPPSSVATAHAIPVVQNSVAPVSQPAPIFIAIQRPEAAQFPTGLYAVSNQGEGHASSPVTGIVPAAGYAVVSYPGIITSHKTAAPVAFSSAPAESVQKSLSTVDGGGYALSAIDLQNHGAPVPAGFILPVQQNARGYAVPVPLFTSRDDTDASQHPLIRTLGQPQVVGQGQSWLLSVGHFPQRGALHENGSK